MPDGSHADVDTTFRRSQQIIFNCVCFGQALIEVRILDHLRKKDKDSTHHVIHMLDYFYFRNHLCISFELMR